MWLTTPDLYKASEKRGLIRDICAAHQKPLTKVKLCLRLKLQSPVRNVGSLSIDMSTYNRPMYRSRCVGQHIDRHIDRDIGRYVGWHVDRHISSDTSAESRSTYRPTLGRCSTYRPTYRSRGAQTTHDPNWKDFSLWAHNFTVALEASLLGQVFNLAASGIILGYTSRRKGFLY